MGLIGRWIAIVIAAVGVVSVRAAFARSIDVSPCPAILLSSGDFLTQSAWDSVTLYRGADGKPIRSFNCPEMTDMAVTTDGKSLIIAGYRGDIWNYNLQTGALLWKQNRAGQFLYIIAVSADGRWFAAGGDSVRVGRVQTGAIVRTFPGFIQGVALSPDGSKGAIIESEKLRLFDVTSGKATDTGITGFRPICYSADGKYLVFSDREVKNPVLKVLPSGDPSAMITVPAPDFIGHIKAAPDGRFLITVTSTFVVGPAAQGLLYDPATNQWRTLWQTPVWFGATPRPIGEYATDFDTTCAIGVSTNYMLMTDVIDLQKGTVLYTINNSANSPITVCQRQEQRKAMIWMAVVGLGLLAAAIATVYGIRSALAARRMARRGFECLPGKKPGRPSATEND